jgi:hypothetical protein
MTKAHQFSPKQQWLHGRANSYETDSGHGRAIMATVVFWLVGQHFYFQASSASPPTVKVVVEGAKGPRCYYIEQFQTGDDGRRR